MKCPLLYSHIHQFHNRILACNGGNSSCYLYSDVSDTWEKYHTPESFELDSNTVSIRLDHYGIYFINSNSGTDYILDFNTGGFEVVEKISIYRDGACFVRGVKNLIAKSPVCVGIIGGTDVENQVIFASGILRKFFEIIPCFAFFRIISIFLTMLEIT